MAKRLSAAVWIRAFVYGTPRLGSLLQPCMTGHGVVCALAISPDGRTLLVGCEDGWLQLWDVQSGQCQRVNVKVDGPLQLGLPGGLFLPELTGSLLRAPVSQNTYFLESA